MGKITAPAMSFNEVGAGRRRMLAPAMVVSRICPRKVGVRE